MLTLIVAVLSLIIGGLLIYLVLRPRLNNIQKLNEEVARQNIQLKAENLDLDDNYFEEVLKNLNNYQQPLLQSQNQHLKNNQ